MGQVNVTHATVRLDDIREPARNPNYMSPDDFEALCAVVAAKGFFQPPLLRRVHPLGSGPHDGPTWEVVDGVHRVRACLRAGLTEVQAVCTDLDETGARVLQVSMNKLRGELNLTAVAETVRELVDAGMAMPDLQLIGYSDDELRAMLDATKTTTEEDILADSPGGLFDDLEPEEPAKPKPYILELTFATAADLRRVKRTLKKAGSGDHAAGLLRLIDGA